MKITEKVLITIEIDSAELEVIGRCIASIVNSDKSINGDSILRDALPNPEKTRKVLSDFLESSRSFI